MAAREMETLSVNLTKEVREKFRNACHDERTYMSVKARELIEAYVARKRKANQRKRRTR